MSATLRSVLCVLFSTALWSIGEPSVASAQGTPQRESARRAGVQAKPHKKRAKKPRVTRARRAPNQAARRTEARRRSRPTARAAHPASADAPRKAAQQAAASAAVAEASTGEVDAEIVKEGDTRVKVMKFGALGIEGRLKSPQLVYFVQRVRAEFERPVLPHRSFMAEVGATTAREPVR